VPDGTFLQAEGRNLVYRGQTVVLKGVNFVSVGALGAAIGSGRMADDELDALDYANLSAQGANHARLGLSYNWYADDRADFFARLDRHVAWATEHGIWLALTLFTTPGDCYEGYSNSCPLWDSPAEQEALVQFWVALAERYRDRPAVAGYDLLNEPTPPDSCEQWYDLAGRVRDAVAAVAPNQLVFISSCSDPANDLLAPNLPRGANIVYQVHDYSPLDMSHDQFSPGSVYPGVAEEWFGSCYYNKQTFQGVVRDGDLPACALADLRTRFKLDWAAEQDVPIYIGEWGATSLLEGYVQYHRDKAELYRDWGVNHAAYTWKHQTIVTGGEHQWGIYSAPHRLDDPERLAAIQIAWEGAVRPEFGR
jgi:hypothetical protein